MSEDINNNSKNHGEHEDIFVLNLIHSLIHEISHPLNGIQMNISNILADRISMTDAKKRLQDMDAMVEKIRRELRNFILLTNPNSNLVEKGQLSRISFDKFFKSLIKDFSPQANSKGLHFVLEADEQQTNDLFEVDTSLLTLILGNILDNAIRYSYPKSNENTHILINYKLTSLNLEIKVTNWGYPVMLEEENKIFQMGYRGQNAMRYSPSGAGIGLFLVKKCVKVMNGEVHIKSIKNEFSIVLKLPKVVNEKSLDN